MVAAEQTTAAAVVPPRRRALWVGEGAWVALIRPLGVPDIRQHDMNTAALPLRLHAACCRLPAAAAWRPHLPIGLGLVLYTLRALFGIGP